MKSRLRITWGFLQVRLFFNASSVSRTTCHLLHTHTYLLKHLSTFLLPRAASLETLWHQEVCLETSWNRFSIGHWTHHDTSAVISSCKSCSRRPIPLQPNFHWKCHKWVCRPRQAYQQDSARRQIRPGDPLGCQTSSTKNPSCWHGNICLLIGRQVYQQVPGVEKPTWKNMLSQWLPNTSRVVVLCFFVLFCLSAFQALSS